MTGSPTSKRVLALARSTAAAAAVSLVLAAASGCASGGGSSKASARSEATTVSESAAVKKLGEPYATVLGDVHFIRVQDEYRLIRCIPASTPGVLAGCYEDVFTVSRESLSEPGEDGISWNSWMRVSKVPGLEVAFLDPSRIAFRGAAALQR